MKTDHLLTLSLFFTKKKRSSEPKFPGQMLLTETIFQLNKDKTKITAVEFRSSFQQKKSMWAQ